MISVVIPLYNKAATVGRTLAAVLAQTFQDFEVVVVDDGSADGSAEVVRAVGDRRVRLLTQPNGGVSAARNRGIDEARGELVAFLDADDVWEPDYLSTQMRLVEHYPECDVFAVNYHFSDSRGRLAPTVIRRLPFREDTGLLTNYFEVAGHSHPPLWTSAVVVRTASIRAVGGFPVGVRSGEDLLTWARLAVRCKIAYCRQPKAIFVFDEQAFNDDQKRRAPESVDVVGRELGFLYREHHEQKGLAAYVALWHKMRTRIFILKRQRRRAVAECVKSMRYHLSFKILVFFVLALLPYQWSARLFSKLG